MSSADASPKVRRGAARGRAERLSVDDWTAAALELVVREGVGAVKINRLCAELEVTKGSFYWHFDNIAELFEAVADRWCALTRSSLEALAKMADLPAPERLQLMTEGLIDDRAWAVERAVRDWARTDARIAEAVATSDAMVLEIVQRALLDHGIAPDQARVRAGLLVYAGIGFAHGADGLPKPTREEIARILALLTEIG